MIRIRLCRRYDVASQSVSCEVNDLLQGIWYGALDRRGVSRQRMIPIHFCHVQQRNDDFNFVTEDADADQSVSCDFDKPDICGYTQSETDDFDWIRAWGDTCHSFHYRPDSDIDIGNYTAASLVFCECFMSFFLCPCVSSCLPVCLSDFLPLFRVRRAECFFSFPNQTALHTELRASLCFISPTRCVK